MATYTTRLRQGLPRVPGGEPWPAGGEIAGAELLTEVAGAEAPAGAEGRVSVTEQATPDPVVQPAAMPTLSEATSEPRSSGRVLRQGLPRVAGGEPWPTGGTLPGGVAPAAAASSPDKTQSAEAADAGSAAEGAIRGGSAEADGSQDAKSVAHPTGSAAAAASDESTVQVATPQQAASTGAAVSEVPLRQGLPRTPGGQAWPAAGVAPAWAERRATDASSQAVAEEPAPSDIPNVASVVTEVVSESVKAAVPEDVPLASAGSAAPAAALPVAPPVAQAQPSQAAPTAKSAPPEKPAREPIMIGAKTLAQWVKIGVLGAISAIVAAGIIVLAARGVTTLPGVPAWLERYPGEYPLPETAESGFPAWARWGHFFNLFLMVLIIRSGWLVRAQQKPPAFWTPKKGGKKISINLWLHTSLDVLWVVNGLVFVVLLFASGHWMRIVPTSWEVFPNAASAMLQYLTLDWPVEDGWVNYNALQQIMYFLVVFVAAPLAIITGVRMSEWWPQNATKLNKVYPAPIARAIHFPTMLFFVLFIMVHVFLVFTTGALKNLNHMFVGTPIVSWTGFWLFALSIAVTVGGWFACKPLVLAPIASLFGKVSNR